MRIPAHTCAYLDPIVGSAQAYVAAEATVIQKAAKAIRMHARGIVGIPLTVQEETSREVVISLAFDQRGVLDVPLVHGPDPVWSALQSQGHPVW